MNSFFRTTFAAALLLSASPAFAEDAHHPATTEAPGAGSAPKPAEPAAPAVPAPDAASPMMGRGMMGDGMMKMMQEMMGSHAAMMRGMMSAEGMADSGPMRGMMSPERVEGRIAFLRTELKVTDAQQPLWEIVAEALRANAAASKSTMPGMMGGMPQPGASQKLSEKLADMESMLSARLDALRRFNTALEPFYASLDETQKATADDLLMPMGMM